MKKAIIIGATSGLGREVAGRLVRKGWKVGVCGRRTEALESFRDEYGSDKVCIATMDVMQEEAADTMDRLISEMGSPDLFFYVSGIGLQNLELDVEKEVRMVKTNSEGFVRLTMRFLNYVKNSGEYSRNRRAHVAVVTSVAGTAGLGTAPGYSATKKMQMTYISALAQLSRMIDLPVDFTDIRPGFVKTDILNPNKHYPMLISLEDAGNHIVKALERRKRILTFDWRFKVLVCFWKLIPRWLWERLSFITN